MTTLVTGGTGFVGAHVVRALRAEGDEVRCLLRPSSPRANLEGTGALPVEGDLRDPDSLRPAVDGCQVVYHCAADYRLWAPRPEEIYASNVEGTRNLLAACRAQGVGTVVHTSSVGALGLRADGEPADEGTPVELADMVGHYKRSKFLAERVAEEFADRGLRVVIVNPSTPVGELDIKPTPTGQIIVDFLRGRMPAYVDTGLNLVDVRDVAAGHLLAARRGESGSKYILGHRNLTLRQLLETLARLTGRPAPRIRLPHWIPLTVAAVSTAASKLTHRPPRVPLESVRMARKRMFFDAGKAVRELDLPQTPIEDALQRAVTWFLANGYVAAAAGSGTRR